MADGLNTAVDILNTGAGIAGMIPGYGTAISAALGVVGGFMKKGAAAEQASRAAELRQQANSVQKMPLRQEYLKSLKAQQMAALYGLPQYNQRVQQIDTGIANNIRAIKESSPSGAATLATISAVLNNANAAKNNLAIQDAHMQMRKQQQVANTIWNTGDKQMDLVELQRQDRAALNQGAMNLENAATANKIGAIDEILASVAGGVQGVTKAAQLGGGANSGMYQNFGSNFNQSPSSEVINPQAESIMGDLPSNQFLNVGKTVVPSVDFGGNASFTMDKGISNAAASVLGNGNPTSLTKEQLYSIIDSTRKNSTGAPMLTSEIYAQLKRAGYKLP